MEFVFGLLLGAVIGVFFTALCAAAKDYEGM
jgi:hypothetical protein